MSLHDPNFKWRPAGSPINWEQYGFKSREQQRLEQEEAERERQRQASYDGAIQVAQNLGLLKCRQ